MSRPWLVKDGRIPDGIVVPHVRDRARLARLTPEAVSHAVVGGDPCFDRMQASRGLIAEYRAALGVAPEAKLVTVSSTWGPNSLLGRHPDIVDELVAELCLDEYVVAAICHPRIWFAHGPMQLRMWWGNALRSGLRLIPAVSGWQQTVLASDLVIGDHGSVTGYAAANATPTLVTEFPVTEVARGSLVEVLGQLAPRLDRRRPFVAQIDAAMAHDTARSVARVVDLITSLPGRSAEALRSMLYRLMDLEEPTHPALLPAYSPTGLVPERGRVAACWVRWQSRLDSGGHWLRVWRWGADVIARGRRGPHAGDTVLAVARDHPRRDLTSVADIVTIPDRGTDITEIAGQVLRQHTACSVVATDCVDGQVLVRLRDGPTVAGRVVGADDEPMLSTIVAVAAMARVDAGMTASGVVTVDVGIRQIRLVLNEISLAAP